ncbi:MAG: HAD-IA family hydrolase [Blautia sp.]|nr:HAD-IA family hydrolase [Blautia sp.]
MIKALFFDLDNTLYDYNGHHKIGYENLVRYAEEKLGMDRATFGKAYKDTMAKVEAHLGNNTAAIHDRYVRFQVLLEDANLPLSPHALGLTRCYWDSFMEGVEPFEGVREALLAAKEAGYILGIGTNMVVDYQLIKLEKMELLNLFDVIVSSEEAGAEKPYKEFFDYCAAKAGCLPEECVFIGDNLLLDIHGADRAGFHPLWYQPDRQVGLSNIYDFFSSYEELLPYLDRIAKKG